MQKLILYLFALIFFIGAKAQSLEVQLEQAKFNIIKSTVEFLSTDNVTFKNVKSNTCAGCKSFADLKKFVADNDLKNADKIVIDPLVKVIIDSSENTWQASINKFKQKAHDIITTGNGRKERVNLKGYNDYVANINAVVKGIRQGEISAAQTTQAPSNITAVQLKQPADSTVSYRDPPLQANGLLPLFLQWMPYVIIVLLVGTLIYLVSDKNKIKQRKRYYKDKTKRLSTEVEKYKESVLALTSSNEQLKKELNDSEVDVKFYQDRLKVMEEKNQPMTGDKIELPVTTAEKPAVEKPAEKPIVQRPKPSVANIKFAKYADLGDGFSNAELLDNPDNETIFELTIASNNTGEYKITSNADAQRYALTNAQYFLGKTCQYDSFPSENAVIHTDTPGMVKLNGGKWTITNPAKITFS